MTETDDQDARRTRPFADVLREREAVQALIDQVESELELRVLLGTPRPARELP